MKLSNERGQGLIEYLIIVAIMAIATIGVLRVVGQNLTGRFADIAYVLQGKQKKSAMEQVEDSYLEKKTLGTFMEGAGRRENK